MRNDWFSNIEFQEEKKANASRIAESWKEHEQMLIKALILKSEEMKNNLIADGVSHESIPGEISVLLLADLQEKQNSENNAINTVIDEKVNVTFISIFTLIYLFLLRIILGDFFFVSHSRFLRQSLRITWPKTKETKKSQTFGKKEKLGSRVRWTQLWNNHSIQKWPRFDSSILSHCPKNLFKLFKFLCCLLFMNLS